MTVEELIEALDRIAESTQKDPEVDHGKADDLLLDFIADPRVREAFDRIEKWYS